METILTLSQVLTTTRRSMQLPSDIQHLGARAEGEAGVDVVADNLAQVEADRVSKKLRLSGQHNPEQAHQCHSMHRKGGQFTKKKSANVQGDAPMNAPGAPVSAADINEAIGAMHTAYVQQLQTNLQELQSNLMLQYQAGPHDSVDGRRAISEAHAQMRSAVTAVFDGFEPNVAAFFSAVEQLAVPATKVLRRPPGNIFTSSTERRTHQSSIHGNTVRDSTRARNREVEQDEMVILAREFNHKMHIEFHHTQRWQMGLNCFYQHRAAGLSVVASAEEASISSGTDERTVRRWVSKFEAEGEGFFMDSRWGAHPKVPHWLATKTAMTIARDWVRSRSVKYKDDRGEPHENMKTSHFKDMLNTELIPGLIAAWKSDPDLVKGTMTGQRLLKKAATKELAAAAEGEGASTVEYVSQSTALSYLHRLGFSVRHVGKSSFVDGHERDDVVLSRKKFLDKYFDLYDNGENFIVVDGKHIDKDEYYLSNPEEYAKLPATRFTQLPEERRPVIAGLEGRIPIFIYHDESTFRVNDGETWHWSDNSAACKTACKKSEGAAYMISGVMVEHASSNGHLHSSDWTQIRGVLPIDGLIDWDIESVDIPDHVDVTLEVGKNKDGYWGSELFQKQVHLMMGAFENQFNPEHYVAVFIFDHSSGHTAKAEDSRNALKMNVNPGGKQPHMRDGWFWGDSVTQKPFSIDGTCPLNLAQREKITQPLGRRGLRTVLEERGLVQPGQKLNAEVLKDIMDKQPDFQEEMPEVELNVVDAGHMVLWNPKFHAELNPIEMQWGYMKAYTRKRTRDSMAGVKKNVVAALQKVDQSMIGKWAQHARRYMRAYKNGANTDGVEAAMRERTYQTHRSGAEGAVQMVLAAGGGEMSEKEKRQVHLLRARENWRVHRERFKDLGKKLVESKIRRMRQGRMPAFKMHPLQPGL